jgi:hypothetical protein
MKKVFHLLRNNEQSGPFTIGELLQQHLNPNDLIWVDGESQSWSFPSEIPELGGQKEKNKKKEKKHEPAERVRREPVNRFYHDIEADAAALKKKIFEAQGRQPQLISMPPPMQERPEIISPVGEEIFFVDHSKQKHISGSQLLTAGIIAALVLGGVYGGRSFVNSSAQAVSTAASQIISLDEHAARKKAEEPVVSLAAPVTDSAVAAPVQAARKQFIAKRKKDTSTIAVVHTPVIQTQPETEKEIPIVEVPQMVVAEIPKPEIVKGGDEVATDNSRKKSFGQAVKGLFKKKKKEADAEPVKDESTVRENHR